MLREAGLRFKRTLSFSSANVLEIAEEVENLTAWDRPIGWTQHVTLGSPVCRTRRDPIPCLRNPLQSFRE